MERIRLVLDFSFLSLRHIFMNFELYIYLILLEGILLVLDFVFPVIKTYTCELGGILLVLDFVFPFIKIYTCELNILYICFMLLGGILLVLDFVFPFAL